MVQDFILQSVGISLCCLIFIVFFKLPKLKKTIKIKQHREIPTDCKIKSCTISKTKSGKYYVSVLTEFEKEIKLVNVQNVVGLDFAMSELYVSSENEKAN